MAAVTTLPATFVAGDVLTATQMNNLRGAFRVLQVITGTTGSQTSTSSSTYSDTTLTASITPSATSSKILVMVNQSSCYKDTNDTYQNLQLLRGASVLLKFGGYGGHTGSNAQNGFGTQSIFYLDSPATTSATTYKTQQASQNNNAAVGCQAAGGTSSIVLLEISA
jgi:hypothetical protein